MDVHIAETVEDIVLVGLRVIENADLRVAERQSVNDARIRPRQGEAVDVGHRFG
jgi:hypothetical protein